MNKKYVIGMVVVIVILVLIAIFASNQGAPEEQSPAPTTSGNPEQPVAATEPTGNIDDIAVAILGDIESDELPPMESDQSLLSENDSAVNGMGQSLDEAAQ